MLLGFKRRFVPYVLDGSKTHSIRGVRAIAPRVGETCHCYVDPRQKTMALLGRWECVRVETIDIAAVRRYDIRTNQHHVYPAVAIADTILTQDEADLLAWRDGFRHEWDGDPREGSGYGGCFTLMMEFFQGRLPFTGRIIHWRYNEATRAKNWRTILKRIQNTK